MDRAEAIDILVGVIATNSEEENEALDLAIEALGQTESEDCISRQQAIKEFALHDCTNGEVPYFTGKGVQDILNILPPVTPTERTGEWIKSYFTECCGTDENHNPVFRKTPCVKCDQCGEKRGNEDNFCPNCGAKMDGDKE